MTFRGSGCFQVPGDFPISFSNEDLIIISNMPITNPAFTFLNWFRARIFHRNGHFARNTWFRPKLASLNHMSSLVRQNLRRASPLSSNIWGRPHSNKFQRTLPGFTWNRAKFVANKRLENTSRRQSDLHKCLPWAGLFRIRYIRRHFVANSISAKNLRNTLILKKFPGTSVLSRR